MSNPSDQLNDDQTESPLGELDNVHEFEAKAGLTSHSVTGGKGPGFIGEGESE